MDPKDHSGANQEPHDTPGKQNMETQDHPGASQEAQLTPRQQNIGNLDPLNPGAGGMSGVPWSWRSCKNWTASFDHAALPHTGGGGFNGIAHAADPF